MKNFVSICLIAAIWGASHVWVRVAVPVFGAGWVAWARLALGSLVMWGLIRAGGRNGDRSERISLRSLVMVGLLNGALPFLLFAQASRFLPASYLSILNSLTPSFSAIFSWWFLSDRVTGRTIAGLGAGLLGVLFIEEFGPIAFGETKVLRALAEGVCAAACYGLVGVYIKRRVPTSDPRRLVAGSFGVAAVSLFPVAWWGEGGLPLQALDHPQLGQAMVSVLLLGALSSSLAFAWYYHLLSKIGPFRSSLVTQMIPVFGVLWGALWLGERITPVMVIGAGLVLVSTGLILNRNAQRSR